jgi:hypothetical protein
LKNGRYTWRHYKVLPVFANTLEKNRRRPRGDKGGLTLKIVHFVRAGETSSRREWEEVDCWAP